MKLEVEGQPPIENVSATQIRHKIASLRSYGPCSFASLTDESGNYLQVAGGGATCMLERRVASTGQHFRAYKNKKSSVFADGTILSFGGGDIKMLADEWMTSSEAEDVFLAFLGKNDLPQEIMWRNVSHIFST